MDRKFIIKLCFKLSSIYFRGVDKCNTKDFIDTDNIYDSIYVDALFSGIVQNPKLDELANQEIETLIKKYGYDMQSHRAGSICKIIEKNKILRGVRIF